MNRPPTLCLFCGQAGNMSKQHVFPDRLKHILQRREGKRQLGAGNHVRTRGRSIRDDRTEKITPGSMGSSKLRKVCRTCNHGWLNSMEQECVPVVERLILGQTSILIPEDQVRLAKVATSMAMVGEWLHQDYVSTTPQERLAFHDTRNPPPGWYVFIGRNGVDFDDGAFFTEGLSVSEKRDGKGVKHYSAFTMVMGPVLLHVISLARHYIFDVDSYAQALELAPICPTTDWINFGIMPVLNPGGITRIRTYARMAFRQLEER